MRVTVIELPATYGDPARALELVAGSLAAGPPTDLVLLPETSLTGYVSPALDFDLTRFAEPIDGPTASALSALARRHRTHLFGPLILAEDGAYYNATIGFDPDGRRVMTYRKRHPWIPEEWATAGREPYPLVDVGGKKLTIACCYDVHFLADEAAHTLDRADLLLFPSAWVEEVTTRPRRLRALAKTHRVAIAAANWGRGAELAVLGQGGSAILDSSGAELARVAAGTLRADATI